MTNSALDGKPYAGNPHVRFDEGDGASAKPRRSSLLYKRILVMLCVAVSTIVMAKTTTWIGGATGQFSAAANWDNGVPASGDTVKFTKAVELTGETFDIGADGLVIDNSAALTDRVVFTGAGRLTKTGAGQMVVRTNSFHTGGTRIERGKISFSNRYSMPKCFGSGEIELVRYSDYSPTIDMAEWTCGLTNAIRVTGAITMGGSDGSWGAIYVHNPATLDGPIVCDSDAYFNIGWGGVTMNGAVTCPTDRTLKINCNCGNNGGTIFATTLNQAVDASIVKLGNRNLNINGICPNKDSSLTVNAGTNLFGTAASWAGTNIVVSGSTAVLRVQRNGNLASPETVLKVDEKGRVVLDSGVTALVAEFWLNGVRLPDGAYSAVNCPDALAGSGGLVVGSALNVWIAGAHGSWNKAENWSFGAVPQSGGTAVFTNAVTLYKEDVDIGADGVKILNSANLVCSNSFTGAGCLTKLGSGNLEIRRADSSHTGGTVLKDGMLVVNNRYTKFGFGTGAIVLHRISATLPRISMSEWDCGLTNDIVVVGAITSGNGAITATNPGQFKGSVSGDADILITGFWGGMTFHGPISFPGHTVSILCDCKDNKGSPFSVTCNKSVDASIVKTGLSYLYLNGQSTNPSNALTINVGTNQLGTSAFWAGTNIVVAGSNAALRLTASGNLSPDATLALSGGGKAVLDAGVKAQVAALVLDGVPQKAGYYNAVRLPQYIGGAGRIVVGIPGVVILVR